MEFPGIINALIGNGMSIIFLFLAAAFLVHAIIISYHWLAFGTHRHLGLLAIITYLAVGILLLGAMVVILFIV